VSRTFCLSFALLLLVSNPAVAETGADEASTRDFDIQGADAASVSGLLLGIIGAAWYSRLGKS